MSDIEDEVKCSECPNARYGFDRDASHNAGRYVCECELHKCPAESLHQQLAEVMAVRENCTLVPTAELKKMQEQLVEKDAEILKLNQMYPATAYTVNVEKQLATCQLHEQQYRQAIGNWERAESAEEIQAAEANLIRCLTLRRGSSALDRIRAEYEAQIQQLREALSAVGELMLCGKKDHLPGRCAKASNIAIKALSIPTDTSALEALIAKAGEVMREHCCELITEIEKQLAGHGNATSAENCNAIRALPSVTLEDIK